MALTVLVVNDDLTQRRLLEAAINSHGYDVETGKSGETAIAFMQSEKTENVHLMLLELAMSDQDKFEVPQKYQIQLTRNSNHPIDGPKRDQKNGKVMRAGAADFISKPTNPVRLLVPMENALMMNNL